MWTFTGIPRLDSEGAPSSTFREYAPTGSTDHGLILRGTDPVNLYLTPSTIINGQRESILYENDGNRVNNSTGLPSIGPIQPGSVIISALFGWSDNLTMFEVGYVYDDHYFIYRRSTAAFIEIAHITRNAFGSGPLGGATLVSGNLFTTVNPHTGLPWNPGDFSSSSDFEFVVRRDSFTGLPGVYKIFGLSAGVFYNPPTPVPTFVTLPPVPVRVPLEQGSL